jgi:hypothetical protein
MKIPLQVGRGVPPSRVKCSRLGGTPRTTLNGFLRVISIRKGYYSFPSSLFFIFRQERPERPGRSRKPDQRKDKAWTCLPILFSQSLKLRGAGREASPRPPPDGEGGLNFMGKSERGDGGLGEASLPWVGPVGWFKWRLPRNLSYSKQRLSASLREFFMAPWSPRLRD